MMTPRLHGCCSLLEHISTHVAFSYCGRILQAYSLSSFVWSYFIFRGIIRDAAS